MRKFFIVTVTAVFLSVSAQAFASDVTEGMGERASRGVKNLFTGILEVPYQIKKGFDKGVSFIGNEPASKTVGGILGIFRGIGHAAGRMSSGGIELFSFWAVSPTTNKDVGIPLDAENAWDEGTQYSIFEPSFGEGIKPIFYKLGRGLQNGFLGICELPGQFKKEAKDGHPIKGALKGFWYWGSRAVYGFGDVTTSLVPNPVDNKGVHFEEENPWDALAADDMAAK